MPSYRTIGLMSGTSLDGVDAACCRIEMPATDEPLTETTIELEASITDEYDAEFRRFIEGLCTDTATIDDLAYADIAVGKRFARAVNRLCSTAGIDPKRVDLLGSHGQTVWHAPQQRDLPGDLGKTNTTLQIGDESVLAAETGIDAVGDFRRADIAAGGHGAPLSPLLDWLQFADGGEHRIVQNIGGIGNCTLLPRGPTRADVTAFDTGPGNMVIDAVVQAVTDGEQRYDDGGRLAATGTVDEAFLETLLDDAYFEMEPPKSTGRERYGGSYVETLLAEARNRGLEAADLVATATALTSASIADAYNRYVPFEPDRVIVSGGGAWNDTLLSQLEARLSCPVETSGDRGIDPDFREAALFGLLGALFREERPGSLPSVTGADRAAILGTRAKRP
ncbi:anhydro-N-acetylmuramic acid kinase [Natronorubrum sp. JWXQ-INN-674]|uniref:Anhydro-N-acetylmuramic acid kinase n=1 Tax=Natronorubrum halalkaliphilum TaxID=2691917 RepID=A0A6B0VFE4_9EURY|nr:anhydro-N-acetylmuramic acid kinase [Natronorubrum halalkaliphilum]MXV60491.1 anhydro-N-acetylmuramic acid kinase [Natronorubrum halalkaliphilum]